MRITKSKTWYYNAFVIATLLAWVMCVVPTLIAGFIKLPIIVTKKAESTLTGSFTVMLICAVYPLYKGILKLFKSPSAWMITWILWGVSFLLYKIPHATLGALVVVFLVAAIGNTIGAILFWLGNKCKEKYLYCASLEIHGGIK